MNWLILWKSILIFTLVIYTVLVIIVGLGGIKDVVALLHDLSGNGDVTQK